MTKALVVSMPGMDLDLTYYISGPMAGYENFNFPMFELAVRICQDQGIKTLSPHSIVHKGNDLLWQDYLRGDIIEMLKQCHGIILLPGWPQSKGARMELDVALKLDWPVYYLDVASETLTNFNRKVITV